MSLKKPYAFVNSYDSDTFIPSDEIFFGYILKRCYIDIIKNISKLIDDFDGELYVDDLEEHMNNNKNIKISKCFISINQQPTDPRSNAWQSTNCNYPDEYVFLILRSVAPHFTNEVKLNKRKQITTFLKEYYEDDNVCFL